MPNLAHRLPLLAVLAALAAAALLVPSAPASSPDRPGPEATSAATKVKACKRRKGESRKRWLKRCKCGKLKRGETRSKFRKRCPGAKVPKPAPTGGGTPPGQTTPPPPPAPVVDPVRNDAGFGEILGRTDFLRTYQPSPSATHSEWYRFCATRIEPHHYEGIAYIYESRGPWRVIEGYVNGDGTKGYGTIEFIQEQANFQQEVGKVQIIKYTWPAPGSGRSDVALIEHPEIGSHLFARSVRGPC